MRYSASREKFGGEAAAGTLGIAAAPLLVLAKLSDRRLQ
ncbi:hypothetical protein PLANPX_4751 [Lacipirellula parvula]|uniref:Uncharacterized protein n=1 Tax=Lacipirellula parvula TaxID=2650471 RepID=A0A5K7XPA3_9BACT|nr:hypothetical protein PLANPX_4751 [Lacipirellula parvula]